jgi:multidrug efflux pump subunit AcrA (membrane-fusion protein)
MKAWKRIMQNQEILEFYACDGPMTELGRSRSLVLGGQQGLLSANVAAAEAALTTARLRLGYTRIVAPVDGVVGERHVQEGDYVNVGSNLITKCARSSAPASVSATFRVVRSRRGARALFLLFN